MSRTREFVDAIRERLESRVFGLRDVAEGLALARVAGGHVLLEGPPGVGKTLLARTFAEALGGRCRRIQGTPDLLPGDVTGVVVFSPDARVFDFRPGPLFAEVVLFDEVNRASPKTQSALLEAMEERHVTVEGESRPLPDDFTVIATQNPLEFEGTYPLPESQLDRFLLRLDVEHAPREDEARALATYAVPGTAAERSPAPPAVSAEGLAAAREEVAAVRVDPLLLAYVLDLAERTRRSEQLALGLSTRGARALLLSARVHAALRGFDFVRPDDVQALLRPVLAHRLVPAPEAALAGLGTREFVDRLLEEVPVPRVEARVPAPDGSGAEAGPDTDAP